MSNIIVSLLSGIGSLAKYSFWTTVTGISLIGGYAHLTQPTDTSFDPYFSSLISNNSGWITQLLAGITSSALTTKTFKNFLFFKIATVQTPNTSPLYFIGAFQNWYPIQDRKLPLFLKQ